MVSEARGAAAALTRGSSAGAETGPMPEGPSIVILREEAGRFAGRTVARASANSRQDIARLERRRVLAVCSWGKHFLLQFSGFGLRVHFLLFGSWRINETRDATPRLSLAFSRGEALNLYACSVRFLEGRLEDHYDWSLDVMADAWDAGGACARGPTCWSPTRCWTSRCSRAWATSSRTKGCTGSASTPRAGSARCRRASSPNWWRRRVSTASTSTAGRRPTSCGGTTRCTRRPPARATGTGCRSARASVAPSAARSGATPASDAT